MPRGRRTPSATTGPRIRSLRAGAAIPCGTRTRPRRPWARGQGRSPRASRAARRGRPAPAGTASGPRRRGCYRTVRCPPLGRSAGRGRATLEHLEQRVDHLRVELGARVELQLTVRALAAHRLPVGAVARHRLVRLAGENDPRAERDAVSHEVIWVTLSVPALVTVAHQREGVGQEVDGLED